MARFHGAVGFGIPVEIRPGVWDDQIVERNYYGDVIRNTRRWSSTDEVNDNLKVDNMISIVVDSYAQEHFFQIKFIRWQGVSWTVSNVQVERPRAILYLGEVYNGPEA